MKEVLNWAAYLKHLRLIFQKFDSVAVFIKEIIIQYFWDDLKSFIKIKINMWDKDFDNQNKCAKKKSSTQKLLSLFSSSCLLKKLIFIVYKVASHKKPKTEQLKNSEIWLHLLNKRLNNQSRLLLLYKWKKKLLQSKLAFYTSK